MSWNSLISRRCCLLALLLSSGLTGCGESAEVIEQRDRAEFDKQVETTLKKDWVWLEALQFLEKGGEYVDSGEPGVPKYDKPNVLPLLQRLTKKHGLKWQAICDKKQRSICVAIVGQFPDSEGAHAAVMETLNVEQKSFPLDILVTEGNRWLSIDFMTPENAKFLEDGTPSK
jgi:hypothetical protein